jgi:hypothetical protein
LAIGALIGLAIVIWRREIEALAQELPRGTFDPEAVSALQSEPVK